MNRILKNAGNYWHNNRQLKAISLAKKHNLQIEFEEQFGAISYLVRKENLGYLKVFVADTDILTRESISYLSTNKNLKHALSLLGSFNLQVHDFPDLLYLLKNRAIRDLINSEEISIYNLIDIYKDDLEAISIIASELYNESFHKNIDWMMELVRGIASKYPTIYPNSSKGQSRPIEDPNDAFASIQENCIQLDRKVVFVESEEILERIELDGEVAGLDCEWKPSFIKYIKHEVSILQIAFPHIVYVIDFLNLKSSSLLKEKINKFFNSNVPKLGVSFDCDMVKLRQSYPDISYPNKMTDLVQLYQYLYQKNPGGLKGLCESTLGKSLCKNQQVSNWNNRPLRKSQLHYAALDAFVQIPIWNSLGNITFETDNSVHYPPPVKCKNCGSRQHEDCNIRTKCRICHRFGHITTQCPNDNQLFKF